MVTAQKMNYRAANALFSIEFSDYGTTIICH